jgi:hypothetical protein
MCAMLQTTDIGTKQNLQKCKINKGHKNRPQMQKKSNLLPQKFFKNFICILQIKLFLNISRLKIDKIKLIKIKLKLFSILNKPNTPNFTKLSV